MKSTEIIFQLMAERNISAAQIVKDTGITKSLFTQWKQGLQQPSQKNLAMLADYFHVSVDFLLGKEQAADDVLTDEPQITILSRAAKNMTKEQKDKLVEMAKLLYPEAFKEK